MAPIEEVAGVTLKLHPLHGLRGEGLKPLRIRSKDRDLAHGLAEAVAAKTKAICPDEGTPCRVIGSTLRVPSGDREVGVDLVMAETSAVEVSDCPEWLIMAIVPLSPVLGSDAVQQRISAATNGHPGSDVLGWALICRAGEESATREVLGAAGCLGSDLQRICKPPSGSAIGSGSFAQVYRARGIQGSDVAVKQISTVNVGADGGLSAAFREVACLARVQPHRHIIGFHGVFTRDASAGGGLAVVLDLAPGGDLAGRCHNAGQFSEAGAANVLQGVLTALAHLHRFGMMHRDVKPENVLLMSDGRSVLSDFGAAAHTSEGLLLDSRVGSLGYVAPEVLLGKRYGCAVDCFGAGGVLHFCLVGQPPFDGPNRQIVMRKTCQCRIDLESRSWSRIGVACKGLLQSLLCSSPKERLTAVEGIQHQWFAARDGAADGCGDCGLRKVCSLKGLMTLASRLGTSL